MIMREIKSTTLRFQREDPKGQTATYRNTKQGKFGYEWGEMMI